jgi:hypothetical protein
MHVVQKTLNLHIPFMNDCPCRPIFLPFMNDCLVAQIFCPKKMTCYLFDTSYPCRTISSARLGHPYPPAANHPPAPHFSRRPSGLLALLDCHRRHGKAVSSLCISVFTHRKYSFTSTYSLSTRASLVSCVRWLLETKCFLCA